MDSTPTRDTDSSPPRRNREQEKASPNDRPKQRPKAALELHPSHQHTTGSITATNQQHNPNSNSDGPTWTPPQPRTPNPDRSEHTFPELINVYTTTSRAFDQTFKRPSKHSQIGGFTSFKEGANKFKLAVQLMNKAYIFEKDSVESMSASMDPDTWKKLFGEVYTKPSALPLSKREVSSLQVISVELAKTKPFIFPTIKPHPSIPEKSGVLITQTVETAMYRGAGDLWG